MNAFGGKSQVTKPPEKGSFPLDHHGECKESMKMFLNCMRTNQGSHMKCKQLSKTYLECRMEKGLMQPEDLKKLGFQNENYVVTTAPSTEGKKEDEGFIAGVGVKSSRY